MSDSEQHTASPPASDYRGFTVEHDPCSGGDWLYSLTDPPGDIESGRADSILACRSEIDDWWDDLEHEVCHRCNGTGIGAWLGDPSGCYVCKGSGESTRYRASKGLSRQR